jgi:hypothetical protein
MIFKGCKTLVILLAKHFKVFVFKRDTNLPKGYTHTEKQGYYFGYYLAIKAALINIPKTTDEKGLLLIDTALKEYEKLAGSLKSAINRALSGN